MITVLYDKKDDEYIVYENDKQVIRATVYEIWGKKTWPREGLPKKDWVCSLVDRIERFGVPEVRWLLTGNKKEKPIKEIDNEVIITIPCESRLQEVE